MAVRNSISSIIGLFVLCIPEDFGCLVLCLKISSEQSDDVVLCLKIEAKQFVRCLCALVDAVNITRQEQSEES